MRLHHRVLWALVLSCVAAGALLMACGPTLERPSSVTGVRIMGVRKSAPYAHPGETVHLQMLWEDGRAELPDEVEIFFGFWCLNPPGNSYVGCLTTEPSIEPTFEFGVTEFDVEIPEDSLLESDVPDARPAGSAFVFYGVCAGEFQVPDLDEEGLEPEDLVPQCVDENGEQVDADDFVIGYSQIFIYDELRNENPILRGLKQGDEELTVDCIDAACDEPYAVPDLEGCEDGVLCLEACKDDDVSPFDCPHVSIEAMVDEESVEDDAIAADFGTKQEESIWVHYFVDRGAIGSELKLINDAVAGFQKDFSTTLYSPEEPGPVRVWAVVRDNRGGTAWLRVPGFVKPRE